MRFTQDVFLSVGILCAWLLIQFLLVPYIRLQIRRRASREHTPQPEEIWVQDDGILYIDAVSPSGVELLTYDGRTILKWQDTWDQWHDRLKKRTVWFTGQRRPLKHG